MALVCPGIEKTDWKLFLLFLSDKNYAILKETLNKSTAAEQQLLPLYSELP